jgi:hypothetical protein
MLYSICNNFIIMTGTPDNIVIWNLNLYFFSLQISPDNLHSKEFNLAQTEVWPLPPTLGTLSFWYILSDKRVFIYLGVMGPH